MAFRVALRALAFAGRRPWLAFFNLRWGLAIEIPRIELVLMGVFEAYWLEDEGKGWAFPIIGQALASISKVQIGN